VPCNTGSCRRHPTELAFRAPQVHPLLPTAFEYTKPALNANKQPPHKENISKLASGNIVGFVRHLLNPLAALLAWENACVGDSVFSGTTLSEVEGVDKVAGFRRDPKASTERVVEKQPRDQVATIRHSSFLTDTNSTSLCCFDNVFALYNSSFSLDTIKLVVVVISCFDRKYRIAFACRFFQRHYFQAQVSRRWPSGTEVHVATARSVSFSRNVRQ